MPEVILICGKLCSGKTTYAKKLQRESKAVILSVDELMLSLLDPYLGDEHEQYTQKAQRYLLDKSLEMLEAGADIILDWGFWTQTSRDFVKAFYDSRNITCRWHYIDIDDETWKARIAQRNSAVSAERPEAYFVDDNLFAKAERLFEPPAEDEIDVHVTID